MFKRKYEFKPDKTDAGALSKLYITKKQRLGIYKWLLTALVLVVLLVIQDVILSQVTLFGASVPVVTTAMLLVCMLHGSEAGSVFLLISATLYCFSGSAPGTYVIALLTIIGSLTAILRQSYLYDHFGSIFLCTGFAAMAYTLCLFALGCFLGYTTVSRLGSTLISGAISLAVIPLLYPIFKAISNIGGQAWKD